MHVTGDISVGNILTIALATISMVFVAGQLRQLLQTLVEDVQQLKADHRDLQEALQAHEERDLEAFGALRESMVEVLLQSRRHHHHSAPAEGKQ